MSLLSTTVGPEHEPLLQLGVVNPHQNKSDAQFGAYGRWTGPFSHQSDHKLLHIIASQPVIVLLHQLAYISCLLANTESFTKIDFFCENNTTQYMTFPKWLTGQHLMVHNTITNFANPTHSVLEEDSAQTPSWDIMVSGSETHSIPWGNEENERTSTNR